MQTNAGRASVRRLLLRAAAGSRRKPGRIMWLKTETVKGQRLKWWSKQKRQLFFQTKKKKRCKLLCIPCELWPVVSLSFEKRMHDIKFIPTVPATAASDTLIHDTNFSVLLKSLSIILSRYWTFLTPAISQGHRRAAPKYFSTDWSDESPSWLQRLVSPIFGQNVLLWFHRQRVLKVSILPLHSILLSALSSTKFLSKSDLLCTQ